MAWRAAVEPIAASAGTVILGLLCLLLSRPELQPRGLGPVGAIGIAGALRRGADLPARRSCCCSAAGCSGRWSRRSTTSTPRTPWAPAGSGAGWPAGRPAPAPSWVVTLLALAGRRGGSCPTLKADGHRPVRRFPRPRSTRSPARRCSPATSRPGPAARSMIVAAGDRADRRVRRGDRDTRDRRVRPVTAAGTGPPAGGRRRKVVDGQVQVQATLQRRRPTARRPRTPSRRLRERRCDTGRHGRAGRRQHGHPTSTSGLASDARPAGDHPGDPAGRS